MAVSSEAETLGQLLARCKDTSEQSPVDGSFVDNSLLTLINWSQSDAIAVYGYVSVLVRRVLNDDGKLVVSECNNDQEQDFVISGRQKMDQSSNGSQVSVESSDDAGPAKKKATDLYMRRGVCDQETAVAIFDGLNCFNMKHFPTTLRHPEQSLQRIKILATHNAFTLFASICKFLNDSSAFQNHLELLVMFVDRAYADKILQLMKNTQSPCSIVMVTKYIPRRGSNIPNYRQVQVTLESLGHIKVARFASCVEEDREDKGLELVALEDQQQQQHTEMQTSDEQRQEKEQETNGHGN